jgi:hypothetical protein
MSLGSLINVFNKIIDILNEKEIENKNNFNDKDKHFITINFSTKNNSDEIDYAFCTCGKYFKTGIEALKHQKENEQPQIYKGFDSIMEALINGKKLKPKNKKYRPTYTCLIDNIDDDIYVLYFYLESHLNFKSKKIMAKLSDGMKINWELNCIDIYNGLEFEEYQEELNQQLEQPKEYIILELEQQLGHKIKIIGDKLLK